MLVWPTTYICFYCDRELVLAKAEIVIATGKLTCPDCKTDLGLTTMRLI
jgi:DNA-directed RNA polymerase subunit RPC12/RpoP